MNCLSDDEKNAFNFIFNKCMCSKCYIKVKNDNEKKKNKNINDIIHKTSFIDRDSMDFIFCK